MSYVNIFIPAYNSCIVYYLSDITYITKTKQKSKNNINKKGMSLLYITTRDYVATGRKVTSIL
jgi:hypothetical protein